MLSFLFLAFLFIFIGNYLAYFLYIRKNAQKPWRLKINKIFEPKISILIPVHNESENIQPKLENIKGVLYPEEKMEVIIVDDASEDDTLVKVKDFMQKNRELQIKIVSQNPRVGKAVALNKALKETTSDIVIVTDADTLWPPDILRKTLCYLSDSKIGAITGRGINRNPKESWVTKSEDIYLQFTNILRLGESKIHSTIRFEGGFCAYKKGAFESFDCETGADDSGTALKIIQNSYRAILVPEAVFYTSFPSSLIEKFKIKVRRANQLMGLWAKCLKLLLKRRLLLPKNIAIPEIILFLFNPIIFLALIATSIAIILSNPFSLISLSISLLILCLLLFARQIFIEVIVDNFILLCALVTFILKRRYVSWERPSNKILIGETSELS